jgi:fructose-bisphosphate aldolase class II
MFIKPANVILLPYLLSVAESGKFAIGAFNPRYTAMIKPVLRAAEQLRSPAIIQIAQVELELYKLSVTHFAEFFWKYVMDEKSTVPLGLHLDHTKNIALIKEAISCGFTSVMIDASSKEFQDNIATTREVVAYAHARGVSVEAELGRIAAGDSVENVNDDELFTDPKEAGEFVRQTGVDALAVSIGTAHGAYLVKQPRIDLERLRAIRQQTQVHLVLHGGSGTPAEMIKAAIQIPGGGVSKINIATDLEVALYSVLKCETRLSESELNSIDKDEVRRGAQAVQKVVEAKITDFLISKGRAAEYH